MGVYGKAPPIGNSHPQLCFCLNGNGDGKTFSNLVPSCSVIIPSFEECHEPIFNFMLLTSFLTNFAKL